MHHKAAFRWQRERLGICLGIRTTTTAEHTQPAHTPNQDTPMPTTPTQTPQATPRTNHPANTCVTMRYKIKSYDVWGNARDGWDVNNVFTDGTVDICVRGHVFNVGTAQAFVSYTPTDRQCSRAANVRGGSWDSSADCETVITCDDRRSGKPLGELDFVGYVYTSINGTEHVVPKVIEQCLSFWRNKQPVPSLTGATLLDYATQPRHLLASVAASRAYQTAHPVA